MALDPVDSASAADFHLWVTFNGDAKKSAEPIVVNDNDITPNFVCTYYNVPSGSGQNYALTIELWDDDGSSGDDLCDISRVAGTSARASIATMTYSVDSNTWNGDDGFAGDTQVGYVNGEEQPDGSTTTDQDDCWLTFTIGQSG